MLSPRSVVPSLTVSNRAAEAVGRTTVDRPASSLTDTELCAAWPVSADQLDRARERRDTVEQTRLAALREGYLDELERRDPAGFRRWMESGARAASDPGKFIGHGSIGHGDDERPLDGERAA